VRQAAFPHGNDHAVQVILCQLLKCQRQIQMFGDAKEVTSIGFDGAVTDTGCGFGFDKPRKNFLNCRFGCGFSMRFLFCFQIP